MEDEKPVKTDTTWYALLVGLPRFDTSLVLGPGISLRPIRAALSVFDLAATGAVGFRHWAVLEPFCGSCTAEIESDIDSTGDSGYDTLNRAWLATALLVLRGFTGVWGVACNQYSWNAIAGHQNRTSVIFKEQLSLEGVEKAVYQSKRDLPPFRGGLLDYHLSCFSDNERRQDPVNGEDACWIQQHFDVFNRLASESEPFRFALEAAIDWRFAKEPRSAVARLWSGIEAVFEANTELVYRISLYCACLLANRGSDRKAKFDDVKKLYGLRSKVVHGETLKPETIYKAMTDSYYLLRDLLVLTIQRGKVLGARDLDEAVFF